MNAKESLLKPGLMFSSVGARSEREAWCSAVQDAFLQYYLVNLAELYCNFMLEARGAKLGQGKMCSSWSLNEEPAVN